MEKASQLNLENGEKPNYTEEFRELIKDTLLGESLPRWKELFPDEFPDTDKADPETLLNTYINNLVNDTYYADKRWIRERLAVFAEAMHPYKDIIERSSIYPAFYEDALQDWLDGTNILVDEKVFSSYVWNHSLREKEKIEDEPARMRDRLEHNPLADAEECNAGVYREELEAQMSDAIFMLRKKGYSTFESGFNDLKDGSQYIGFNKEDLESLKQGLEKPEISKLFESQKVKASLEEKSDRIVLILVPENPQQNMEFWKKLWSSFAEKAIDKGKLAEPPVDLGSYGTFMKRQLKIRNGEKIYLGHGMEYDGMKAVKLDNM